MNEEEGVKIASPQTSSDTVTENIGTPSLGIGDRIQIETKTLGRVIGKIYYLDEDLLRILPDGVSNRLYDFPITAEGIDPQIGVTEILTEPTTIPSFIEQNRLRVGAKIDTFTAEGDARASYIVEALDPDADSVILVDEAGDRQEVNFNFTGIPRDLPFEVLRVATADESQENNTKEIQEGEEGKEGEGEGEGEREGEEGEEGEGERNTQENDEEILGEIDIPIFAEVSDIPVAQRIYPESLQKNSLFVDLLTLLDAPSQKNPLILRQVRATVEVANSLVKQVVSYAPDGTPVGEKQVSARQLFDLVSGYTKVPLARPVLSVARTLLLEHSAGYYDKVGLEEWVAPVTEGPFQDGDFSVNFTPDINEATEQAIAIATSGANDDDISSRLYIEQNIVVNNLQRPWVDTGSSSGSSSSSTLRATYDTDFFRSVPPSDDTSVRGLRPTYDDKEPITYTPERLSEKIPFSLLKALGPTYRKTKTGGLTLAIRSDRASVASYLLFPITAADSLGSTRTYKLSRDIGRTSMEKKWMSNILNEIGNVSEIPGAGTILNIGVHGNTLGNINVADYLREILKILPHQRFLGLDDFRTILIDLGLDNYELDQETTLTLQNRILEDISRVRATIIAGREKLEQENYELAGSSVPLVTPLLDDDSSRTLKETLRAVKLLAEDMDLLGKYTPRFASIDLAIIAFLLTTKPDLTFSALGRQIQFVERSRIRTETDIYLASAKATAATAERREAALAAPPPSPNKCPHVGALNSIKKIKNDSERMALLAKLVTRFQGEREGNYINCTVCEQHLLCIHEVLQIQQVMRPREQEVLQKELYLNMAGGVFHGRYICRNCGQAISELQFDNSIEFNERGVPINGNILDDGDGSGEDGDISNAIGIGTDTSTENIVFDNEAKTLCYMVAKELYEKIGVFPDYDDYKNVVEAAYLRIQTLDSRELYEKKRKAAVAKGVKNIPDYDTYTKGFTVTSVASLILIDIQTHIPDYVVRYTLPGCEAGFGGYPIQQGATHNTGIQYISCALGSIMRNDEPWNRTGFQQIRSDENRRNTIAKFMLTILTKVLETEPAVQQKIAAKLEYLRETFGAEAAEGRPRDKIPFGFLPKQIHIEPFREGKENEKEEEIIVVPEAATNTSISRRKVAAVWIREAHKHALRTAQLVRGNPFAETACCFGPIHQPGAYWAQNDKGLVLPGRAPPVSPLSKSSVLFVHFTPPPQVEVVAVAPMNLAFRIFLKVCYTGPRKGYAHELGYNGVCDNCGLKLSKKYLFPDYTVQTSKKPSVPIIDTGALISDLQAQGVNVTPEFFQEILDISHMNYSIPPIVFPTVTPTSQLMARLGDLEPPPIRDTWRPLLADLITKLTALPKDANETEIALAYGDISEATAASEQFIKRRFNSQHIATILDKWLANDTKQLYQIFLAYIIIPLQRLIKNYEIKGLTVGKSYDLSPQHVDDLNVILERHIEILAKFSASFKGGIAGAKIGYFLEQIQGLATFSQEIIANRVPGGEVGVKYLKRALSLGPLAELLDFNRVPPTGAGSGIAAESLVDKSGTTLVAFLGAYITQFSRESLSYSPDDIRLRIAKAAEKESMNIVSDIDKLDDDAKRVELIKKRLGIGRWSIGGSSLIYAYNGGQYERERDERIKRGETDLGQQDPSQQQDGQQQQQQQQQQDTFDMFGGGGGEAAFYEKEGGYDVSQEDSDDF